MKKIFKKILYPFFLTLNWIIFSLYFKFIVNKDSIELLDDFSNKRVLVLAPHIDDDGIGCGGTIYNYTSNNSTVKIIYLTDGSKSNSEFINRNKLVKKRKKEAKQVADLLGINFLKFLDYPDGKLNKFKSELLDELSSEIKAYQPDVLFAPFIIDVHPDHRAVASILPQILEEENIKHCYLYNGEYPMSRDFINSVSSIKWSKKRQALREYTSQPINFDNILKFNALHAELVPYVSEGAEVFYRYDSDEYKKMLTYIEKLDSEIFNKLNENNSVYKMIFSYFKKTNLEKKIKNKIKGACIKK